MRKNGKLISFRQYKYTDLFFFALVLGLSELLVFCSFKFWFKTTIDKYYVNFMLAIALTVIMRWGWVGGIYAVADGVVLCAMQGGSWQSYLSYAIGCACILSVLLLTKFLGKEKIRGKWYFSLIYILVGWVSVNFGITCMGAILGANFLASLATSFGFGVYGGLSFALADAVIMILRKMNGMFEDQKHYLLRMDAERKELARRDEYGDEPLEIDKESLSILKRWDDGLDN
ncbi:MAG: hypothetical protein K2N23_05840 [Clostridia bacterium]|nr:hypothetical protein [Clostridia bacterium]